MNRRTPSHQFADAHTAIDAFGQRLVRVLDTPRAFRLLYCHSTALSFAAGACFPLARALGELLGPAASLHCLRDRRGIVQHVVVRIHGRYLDANGSFARAELVRYWQEHEVLTCVVRVLPRAARACDSLESLRLEAPLRAYLARTLRCELSCVRSALAAPVHRESRHLSPRKRCPHA